jgi:hypothetical protein
MQGGSDVRHLEHRADAAPAGVDRLRVPQVWVCDERVAGAYRAPSRIVNSAQFTTARRALIRLPYISRSEML